MWLLFILIFINKAFVRPHPDWGDVVYDQAYNNSFHEKMESIQYVCLAITEPFKVCQKKKFNKN